MAASGRIRANAASARAVGRGTRQLEVDRLRALEVRGAALEEAAQLRVGTLPVRGAFCQQPDPAQRAPPRSRRRRLAELDVEPVGQRAELRRRRAQGLESFEHEAQLLLGLGYQAWRERIVIEHVFEYSALSDR